MVGRKRDNKKNFKKNMNVKQMARMGGIARAKKLTKKRRLEISKLANEAKRIKMAKNNNI